MGRDWAVWSSAALASFALLGFGWLPGDVSLFVGFVAVIAFLALGAWAYALADAAYGARGPLVALLAYGLGTVALALLRGASCFAQGASCVRGAGGTGILVAGLLGVASVVAVARELNARRGIIHWGSTLAAMLPLLALVAVAVYAFAVPASR